MSTEQRIANLEARIDRLETTIERMALLLAHARKPANSLEVSDWIERTNAVSPQYDARVQNEINRQQAASDAKRKVFTGE